MGAKTSEDTTAIEVLPSPLPATHVEPRADPRDIRVIHLPGGNSCSRFSPFESMIQMALPWM